MSPESRPEAVPFAPGSRELPPPLGTALADPTTQLLLVVASDVDDLTLGAVISMAEARAGDGHPTLLADAAFEDPRLHERLGTSNLEGLADVFEFGASLPRVVTRPEGHGFAFVPSGGYVPDPRKILRSQRWGRIAVELAADRRAMLIFTLAGTPGLDALSRRVGCAVVVGSPDQAADVAGALDPECQVVAVVEPVPPGDAGAVGAAGLEAPDLSEPLVIRAEPERGRPRALVWVLLVVLVGVLGWVGYEYVLTPGPGDGAVEAAAPVAEPEPEPEPEPVETPIGYSVAVEAHQDLDIAQERVALLQRQEPGILFYLAPVPIRESVWFRVLAGPVTSRDEGLQLMERLIEEEIKSDYDTWAVRPTGYAFLLGEFQTSREAGDRVVVLAQQDIPAYIVTIRYEPGEPRYRVYGGAFENETTANVMAEMLAEAGIDATLVERVGEPIAVEP